MNVDPSELSSVSPTIPKEIFSPKAGKTSSGEKVEVHSSSTLLTEGIALSRLPLQNAELSKSLDQIKGSWVKLSSQMPEEQSKEKKTIDERFLKEIEPFTLDSKGSKLMIAENSPFFGNDLILVRDDAPFEQLPAKYLRKKDFETATAMFKTIVEVKGKLTSDEKEKDAFVGEVKKTILNLLTTEVGGVKEHWLKMAPHQIEEAAETLEDPETQTHENLIAALESYEINFGVDVEGNKLSVPKDSPFSGSDLVVVIDDIPYAQLPLNYIKKKDYDEAINIYNSIVEGKGKIVIEGKDAFVTEVKKNISKLMTRELGRDLFKGVLAKPSIDKVTITFNKESAATAVKEGHFILEFNPRNVTDVVAKTTGGKFLDFHPFITFGHELTHILRGHITILGEDPPAHTLKENFYNLFEQEVITGYSSKALPKFDEVAPLSADEESKLTASQKKEADDKFFGSFEPTTEEASQLDFNRINENSFRSAFGLGPRINYDTYNKRLRLDPVTVEEQSKMSEMLRRGSVEDLRQFLDQNPGILEHQYEEGGDILFDRIVKDLVKHKNLDMFKLLINATDRFEFYDVSEKETNEPSQLMGFLAKEHALQELKFLFTKPGMLEKLNNTDDFEGSTLLHWASTNTRIDEYSSMDMINFLLSKGANINLTNNYGLTPLGTAANAGNLKFLQYLLSCGADASLNVPEVIGFLTIENKLAQLGELLSNPKVVEKINQPGCRTSTSFGASTFDIGITNATPRHKNAIEFLISKGAKPDLLNEEGYTPIDKVLLDNPSPQLILPLFIKHIDLNAKNGLGLTPLGLMAREMDINRAILLLQNGANLAQITDLGALSELMEALFNENPDFFENYLKKTDFTKLLEVSGGSNVRQFIETNCSPEVSKRFIEALETALKIEKN